MCHSHSTYAFRRTVHRVRPLSFLRAGGGYRVYSIATATKKKATTTPSLREYINRAYSACPIAPYVETTPPPPLSHFDPPATLTAVRQARAPVSILRSRPWSQALPLDCRPSQPRLLRLPTLAIRKEKALCGAAKFLFFVSRGWGGGG